jgi:hypothetical protein
MNIRCVKFEGTVSTPPIDPPGKLYVGVVAISGIASPLPH